MRELENEHEKIEFILSRPEDQSPPAKKSKKYQKANIDLVEVLGNYDFYAEDGFEFLDDVINCFS